MLIDVFDKWFPDKFTDFKWVNGSNISIGNETMSATKNVRKFGRSWAFGNGRTFIISIVSPRSPPIRMHISQNSICFMRLFRRGIFKNCVYLVHGARVERSVAACAPLELHFGIGDTVFEQCQSLCIYDVESFRIENMPRSNSGHNDRGKYWRSRSDVEHRRWQHCVRT